MQTQKPSTRFQRTHGTFGLDTKSAAARKSEIKDPSLQLITFTSIVKAKDTMSHKEGGTEIPPAQITPKPFAALHLN